MSPPLSTIRPLLLAHSLPHIPKYGFSQSALSLASLSLPPPYHYAEPLNPASLQTLFGSGREPERALFQEWLEEKRRELKAEFKTQEVGKGGEKEERKRLRRVLERRLEMNEEVRKWLVDAFATFSITATRIPIANVGIKNPFPILNHSLHIADDALLLAWPASRRHLHQNIPLSLLYTASEMHQLALPLDQPSMPSTSAFLRRRLEEYDGLQEQVGGLGHARDLIWNAVRGGVKSRI